MSNLQKHWQVSHDENNIIWLGLDKVDASANTIDNDVLDELNALLQDTVQENSTGLIIYSLKSNFIAGADIKLFSDFKDPDAAESFLRKGQAVFNKIANLQIPTLCMIQGFCLGGGFELALACDYRICEENSQIGLPEILLGIHPGWGGTVRLPQLIGGYKALSEVILTGRALRAKKAKKLGMVDDVVPLRHLKRAAIYYIQKKPQLHKPSWSESLTNHSLVKKIIAPIMRKQVAKRVNKSHYPAPFAVIDLWEHELGNKHAYIKEIESIKHLISDNETSKNLIRVFFLREQLKQFSKLDKFTGNNVHVIGAGVMGGDIAAWCALKGMKVSLEDTSFEKIAPAIARAHKLFKKKLRMPHLVQKAMDNLIPDVNGYAVAKADIIIEAIFENLKAKQDLFKRIESQAKKNAILATNTSSILLEDIAQAMDNPSRIVGIHFFNPVAKMELVEIVEGKNTAKEVFNKACGFVGKISKLSLPVKSSPGFLINRVLMPYLMECVILIQEGHKPEVIDKAATNFGMMMGPVELADTVGLDVCLAVAKNLTKYFNGEVPEKLVTMVEKNKLGRKTKEGFYKYDKNQKPIKEKVADVHDSDITNRLVLRMLNEASACLDEEVVANSDLLDAGMIFGTGFAPFRGGPMNYTKNFGEKNFQDMLKRLSKEYGTRFSSID